MFTSIILFTVKISSAQLLEGGALTELKDNAEKVRVVSGFNDSASVGNIIASAISAILGLLAVIFMSLMILSGFKWMTAAGNEEQVSKAQDTIKAALIGLIVVLAAYAITYYIFTYLPFSRGTAVGGAGGGLGTSGS